MPLPKFLRKQTPVLVPLLRRSIQAPVLVAGSSRRAFANSISRRNSAPTDSTLTSDTPESKPLPLLSDVTSAFDETPEDPQPDWGLGSTPPEEATGEPGGDAFSEDTDGGLRLKKVFIDHRSRISIFRPVLSRGGPTIRRRNTDLESGEPSAEWERWQSNFRIRRVTTEGLAKVSRVYRIPVSMVEKDVDPTRAKLDGLLMKVEVPRALGATMGRMVYISPEYLVREWNFWKRGHKRTMEQESPFAIELGIEMTKLTTREIYNYWYAQEGLGGRPTPELEFVQSLVRETRRSYVRNSLVLKDTVDSLRYSRNVKRIIESLESGGILFEASRGPECVLSRMDALREVTDMGQKVIFQLEKYIDYISVRGLDDKSKRPGQTWGFANFMLRNALLSSDRNDSNIKTYLDTPRDQDIVEYSAINRTYHLPRVQVLEKIYQSFGSFLGLAEMGVRHLIRRKRSLTELALEAYEKILDRIRRNTELLSNAPLEGSGEGPGVPFYGKDKHASRHYARVQVVEKIVQQQERAIFLAIECLRVSPLRRLTIRRVWFGTPPTHPFPPYKVLRFGGARRYSTIAPRPPSSSMPGVPMGLPRNSGKKTRSIRERFEEKEKLRKDALEGISPNIAMKDLSAEVVPSVDSTDDILGHNWEGLGDMSELLDASAAKPLEIGDLSEVRSSRSGNQAELGLYLRPTPGGEPTADFLMTSGNIVQRHLPRITFSVSEFVPRARVEGFITYYGQMIRKMSEINGSESDPGDIAAPRSVTEDILDPVRRFGAAAARLYAAHRPAFDGLYTKWADETEERKITLYEATELAFGVGCNKDPNYNAMLYAAHTALMGDGLHFMGDRGMHRATNVFRVRSKKDIRMIDSVTKLIRKTADEQQASDESSRKPAEDTGRRIMAKFIEKANYLIDLSREYEKEVLVGRKKGAPLVETEEIEELKWDENDKFFIEYVKARVLKYGLQKTPIDGLAPVILRATNRYGEVLDALAADTFLREIGAWSKWENTSLHQSDLDLPGLGRSELGDEDENKLQILSQKDAIEGLGFTDAMHTVRKDWGDMEVFTIDDPDAHEIDDGVSLQRVSGTENWVHVHIANPAAFIPEDHWITEIAKRRATSHYLPDKVYSMLPGAITGVFLGVAPNKPVMSVSIKVNDNGEILDYKIHAGFVRNVRRTTYDAVDRALGSYRTTEFKVDLRIGKLPESQGVAPGVNGFTPQQRRDLQKLREIALAVRRRRTRDGLIAASPMNLRVEVDNGLGSQNHPYNSNYPVLYRGHPAVRLTVADPMDVEYRDSQLMVSEMMSLANNVVSIWSRERGLAMPYRVMEYDYRRPDVVRAIEETVLPRRTDLGRSPFESAIRWLMLLGQTRLQARPGPHMLMGLPTGYTKTTSPLRRYSDMLAQYQIQSVLLGQSPKTRAQLEPMLASVQRTEQTARHISKEASRLWSAVAIKRAWETGLEKYTFPKKLSFLVIEKHHSPTPCNGFVRELGLAGKMRFADKRDEDKIQVGDVASVKICDVRLSERYVWVEFTGVVVEAPGLEV
ncbi:unnamed protein product [Tuber aestivum]|uniref:RNB domain-containing protein n=1 Tax=Tuber aestivum TaxID=59557 RepID=A0A292Q2L8_9PEZI|nr:unnamed protein product [Tuber aestivum]